MRMMTFARRCAKEMLRDPLNLAFGLGFPLVLLLLLSAIQANIPVPLFELVYHDSLFVPCALNTNESAPFKNNGFLRALLHGNIPYLTINAKDAEISKVNLVCRLNRAVALSPMVRHSFIGDGYAVQESEFACGVTVRIDLDNASYRIRWADGTITEGTEENIAVSRNAYDYANLDN